MAGCGQQKTASKHKEQNPGKTVGGQRAAEGSGCGPGGPVAGGGELRQGGESKPRGPPRVGNVVGRGGSGGGRVSTPSLPQSVHPEGSRWGLGH